MSKFIDDLIASKKIFERPVPCPYCGAEAGMSEYYDELQWAVICTNLRCRFVGQRETTVGYAISAWNTKAKPIEAMRERIKQELKAESE